MWDKKEQHTIGVTESGKPIKFHYHEEGLDARDHHEAAGFHDRKRNFAAVQASHYKQLGYMGAAKAYEKLAAHHGQQAGLHFANVLPAKNTKPVTKPGNSTKPSSAAPRPTSPKPAVTATTKPFLNKSEQSKIVGSSNHGGGQSTLYFKTHEDALAHAAKFTGHPHISASSPHKVRLRDNKSGEEYDGFGVHMKTWSLD